MFGGFKKASSLSLSSIIVGNKKLYILSTLCLPLKNVFCTGGTSAHRDFRGGGEKKKELEKTCRLNRSKSFYLNPLVGNCHGQSVIKAQTSLLHSSAESRHARHVLQKVTQLHITLSLWEHLFFPVISQGHMDITTCILSTESPGPEAEKGPISFRITI